MAYDLPTLDELVPGLPSFGRKKTKYPPLPPEQEQAELDKVLGAGIGGLQYLGETLDKPGRAVRGLLAGKPSELLNLIPFSDTMGLTDPSKAVSGRDLLEQHAGLAKNQEGFSPIDNPADAAGDVAGFGVEMLTDPLSYLTLGANALSKSGKLAKAVGISTKGANKYKPLVEHLTGAAPELIQAAEEAAVKQGHKLKDVASVVGGVPHTAEPIAAAAAGSFSTRLPDELLNQKLGGLFGFTTGPLGLVGIHGQVVPEIAHGARAQAIGQGIANAPGKLTRAIPLVGDSLADLAGHAKVLAKGLFHAPSMGQFTPEGQMAGEYAYAARQKAKTLGQLSGQQAADALDNLSKDYTDSFGQALGGAEETSRLVRSATQLAAETRNAGKPDALGAIDRLMSQAHHAELTGKLENVATQLVDQQDKVANAIRSKGGTVGELVGEEAPIGHFGRFINDTFGATSRKAARMFKTTFGGAIQRSEPIKFVPGPILNKMLTDPAIQGLNTEDIAAHLLGNYGEDITKAVATSQAKVAGQRAAKQVVMDAASPEETANALADWLKRSQPKKGMGPGAPKFIEDAALNHSKYMTGAHIADANLDAIHNLFKDNLTSGGVPLAQAFKEAGLRPEEAVNYFGSKFGQQALQQGVTPEAAAAAKSFLAKSAKPEWMEKIADLVDDLTQPLKKNLTLPFPSFLTRNLASGQAMNLMDPSIGSIQDAHKYGKSVALATKILANKEDYKGIIQEAMAHNAISRDFNAMGTELGWGFKNDLPNPISLKGMGQNATDAWQQAKDLAFNSDSRAANLPGKAKTLRAALATPAAMGSQLNAQAEFLNRMSMYLHLRNNLGWVPEAAAQKVRNLQVDYEHLAPFEKEVMRRLVPFYTWTRRVMPEMLSQLAQRPGGTQAQIIRASNTGRSKGEFVPPYIGEGMSVKLGDDTYLSGSGLPTDQYADLFAKGPTLAGTLKRTGQKLMSMTNPYLKGPLELATGKNFYTGQDLQDVYRHPTNDVILNQFLHNSPASRFITSERQLADGRKGLGTKATNLLTGVKIADVSGGLSKQREKAELKLIQEIAREYPQVYTHTDIGIHKNPDTGQDVQIPDSLRDLLRVKGVIEKRKREEAKKKKRTQLNVPQS